MVALKWNFLKPYHHWSPPGAWAPYGDAQEIQVSNFYSLICLQSSITVWVREVEQGLIHLEVLVCPSCPWVGQGLQSISLYDAPSAAWLFRSSLFAVILLKVSFNFLNKQLYWVWLRWS